MKAKAPLGVLSQKGPPSPALLSSSLSKLAGLRGNQPLTPFDLGLTEEEWSKEARNREMDDDSGSEIEVVHMPSSLPRPKAGRAVEGVLEADPFTAAHIRNLHGAPNLSQNPGKYDAYVVFAGLEPGIFQTWPGAAVQVLGIPGAVWKGYLTIGDARRAYNHAKSNGTGGIKLTRPPPAIPVTQPVLGPPSSSVIPRVAPTKPPVDMETTRNQDKGKGKKPPSSKNKLTASSQSSTTASTSGLSSGSISSQFLRSHRQIPAHSDVSIPGTFQPDDQIFIVIRGRRPGVYYGKKAASAGLGDPNNPEAYVEVAADRAEAYAMFVEATMEGDIRAL